MASSSNLLQFPEDIPINIYATDLYLKEITINLNFEDAQFVMEQPIDFEALRVNGFEYEYLFKEKGWENYFKMINGPIYPNLVFDFLRKCDVTTRIEANLEHQELINKNPKENEGKSRTELGLREFKETKIRTSIGGFPVVLTISNLAQI
jgi:hypothetical protein